jgi:hypothetical protein
VFHTRYLKSAGALAGLAAFASLSACGGQSTATPAPVGGTTPSAALSYADKTVGADGAAIEPVAGSGSLGPGFVTPSAPPPPGGTMTPSAGSWSSAHAPDGYRVVLLSSDEDAQTKVLSKVVRTWATKNGIALTRVSAKDPATQLASIDEAIDLKSDLVISVGQSLADPLAVVTASWLDQDFLLLGSELAEPTYNVTAAIWQDGSYRGGASESAATYDPKLFTPARITRALSAGIAAVVSGYDGYVVKVG